MSRIVLECVLNKFSWHIETNYLFLFPLSSFMNNFFKVGNGLIFQTLRSNQCLWIKDYSAE